MPVDGADDLNALDEPRNLFPSLHCFCGWIIARGLMPLKQVKPWVKFSAAAFSLLVCASTLFTRQHLFLDVPGGILGWRRAACCWRGFGGNGEKRPEGRRGG